MARAAPTSQRVLQGATDDRHLPFNEESESIRARHANPLLGQFGHLIL